MNSTIPASVENSQRQPDEALRRAESLRRVIEVISSELALEPLLTRIIESATDLIGAQYGAVGLVREQSGGPVVEIAAVVNMPSEEVGRQFPPDVGLAGRVLREQQPVWLARYDNLAHATIPAFADHTVIGLPIWWNQRMIGFFGIGADPPRRFSEQDVEAVTLFARHAAIAIENARYFECEQRRSERPDLIHHAERMMTAELVIDELLRNTADAIRNLLGYAGVSISLLSPASRAPYDRMQRSRHSAEPADAAGSSAPLSPEVNRHVVAADPPSGAVPGHSNTQTQLTIPLMHNEQVLGYLEVTGAHPFTDDEALNLRVIANQLVVAVEKTRLFEAERRRSARISAINRIGRLITSSLSSETLFQTAVEAIGTYFNFDYVAVGVADQDDPEMLVLLAYTGSPVAAIHVDYRWSMHEGLVGIAARTRQRVLINNNLSDTPDHASVGSGSVAAALVVPVVVGSRLLGMVLIEAARQIDEEEAEGIEIIADQFGVALENARLFGSMQHALEVTQFLYAASQRISTAMSVEEVILAYLEQVAARGQYACSIVLIKTDHLERRTALSICGRWSPHMGIGLDEITFPWMQASFTPLLDAGQTVTFANALADETVPAALRDIQTREGQLALALIPLLVRGRRIGIVLLSCPYVYEWSVTDLQPYQTTAAQLATAIDSRQQHHLLARRGQQLAVLEERRRLARELHDSVTQSLFSMSLLSQVIPDLWNIDRDEAYQSLQQIRELTRNALAEMRALLFELRPADTTEQGLVQLLKQQAVVFEQRTGITVVVELQEECDVPDEVQQALLRIAQEALMNIDRHARARQVRLVLKGGRPLQMRISDNGRGFDPDQVGYGHFGLISMHERASNINARIDIRSATGQGTDIIIEWPAAGS